MNFNNYTVDIDEYLDEETKRQIAEDFFRAKLSVMFETENDIQRMLSNASYDIVSKMCDESMDEKLQDVLQNKVLDIINNLSAFTVFNKPDAWDRDGSSNYHLLKEIVKEKRNNIEDRLNNLINNLSLPNDFEVNLNEEIEKMVMKRLFGSQCKEDLN